MITDISSYPLRSSLPNEYQFNFLDSSIDVYTASSREYIKLIDNSLLWKQIAKLPEPFSPKDPPLSLRIKHFSPSWGLMYSMVPLWNTFNAVLPCVTSLAGMSHWPIPSLKETLIGAEFEKWTSSISQPSPALTSVGVLPLWSLFRDSEDKKVQNAAGNVEAAFKAIIADNEKNRRAVATLIVLKSRSRVAEFGLSTPGSIAGVGGSLPAYDPRTQKVIGLSETKIRFGQSGEAQKELLAAFYIVNDGTPIAFTLCRDTGIVVVLIDGVRSVVLYCWLDIS
ncbi:hypothetical protein PM082_020856 [Marasmius tenuissimus]|nr:hypothetical protein PM082_020856 [Marasmius tenuissimus]